jgi:hypothetical protein
VDVNKKVFAKVFWELGDTMKANRSLQASSTIWCCFSQFGGRILGRNWDKSFKSFSSLLFTVTSTKGFYNPPPPRAKLVWNWFLMYTLYTETSSLRTLSLKSQDYSRKPQWNWTSIYSTVSQGRMTYLTFMSLSANRLTEPFGASFPGPFEPLQRPVQYSIHPTLFSVLWKDYLSIQWT